MEWRWLAVTLAVASGCSGSIEDSGSRTPLLGRGGTTAGLGSSGSSGSSGSPGGAGRTGTGGDGATPPVLGACRVFPETSAWNLDVSQLPVHARSDDFVDAIGRSQNVHPDFGTEYGIPYTLVPGAQPRVSIDFTAYADESDPGPYPIPADAPIEGGPDSDGDRHVIVIDSSDCVLYEMYRSFPSAGGGWSADAGAVWDLKRDAQRPMGWTSADAAGLPVFAGLVRYDEVVEQGEIRHALRFTVSRSQAAFIAPATHYAATSTDPSLPPMGLRLRMKASYDCSPFSREARVVCAALKKYGMLVADNGSSWFISGAPDPRWDDDALGDLKQIPGDAFEAVDSGPLQTY
jgi:hypothetical protein